MVLVNWDSPNATVPKPEKLKNWTPRPPVKRPAKEMPTEEIEDDRKTLEAAGKKDWLMATAAESVIPDEDSARIVPERLFRGLDPLIVHMCADCKKFNAAREVSMVAEGMMNIPFALCTVCRAHLISQRTLKFYKHDCPTLKKSLKL